MAAIEILDPVVDFGDAGESATYRLDGGVAGRVVGLRLDQAWRSYHVVVEEWQAMLEADGASPLLVWPGERVGAEGERTHAGLEEWAKLIDCGVIGLGN